MFTLKKILNGRINVSEPLHLKTPATAALAGGTAVCYDSTGKLVAATGESVAEYVVLQDVPSGSTVVPVILITSDMIFETADVSGSAIGKKYQLSGGTTFTTTAGTAVTVIDKGEGHAIVRLA
jgi:hypothetical protein